MKRKKRIDKFDQGYIINCFEVASCEAPLLGVDRNAPSWCDQMTKQKRG